jgi:hypothetical protein
MTGPSIALPGLPTFNAGDPNFRITQFDGWWATAKPRSELIDSGVSHGSVAVGPWDFAEAYYTLSGVIRSNDRATLMGYRRALLAALPANEDSPIVVYGNDEDVDLQVEVRRYDAPTIDVVANNLTFTFPLVATDPFKYAADLLSGSMATFAGFHWFKTLDPTDFTLLLDPADAALYFETDVAEGVDQAATLTSTGDIASRQLTFNVTGPLTAGEWFLLHETTGRRLWLDLSLDAGQTLFLDCYEQHAWLGASNVDEHVFGDYLTLEPGTNVYRLVTSTDTAGSAVVEARPAYQ